MEGKKIQMTLQGKEGWGKRVERQILYARSEDEKSRSKRGRRRNGKRKMERKRREGEIHEKGRKKKWKR